jgi:hypothetical protein
MLLIGATEAGAAKAAELDGELIALCAESERLEADYCRLCWASDWGHPKYGTPEQQSALAAFAAVGERQQEVLMQIAVLAARTPEGLGAKARALHTYFGDNPPEHGLPCGDALWSLVCDVAGRAPAIRHATSAPTIAAADTSNPDAELIQVCAQHCVNMDAFNDAAGDADGALWAAYSESCDFITASKPQSLAGVLAKAKAARHEANYDEDDWSGTMGEAWAPAIINALLRVTGGAV